MKKFFTACKNYILAVLLPKTCHHCRRDLGIGYSAPLCADCLANLKSPGPLICKRCGLTLPSGGAHCRNCAGVKAAKYKCSIIRSSYVFTPEARCLVLNFKYNDHVYLKDFLAAALSKTFDEVKEFAGVDIICPVPLHRLKLRTRGYNQSAYLAAKLAAAKNIEYRESLLKRTKYTPAQAKLDKNKRSKNVSDAFRCAGTVKGKTVLIIDDVATTGFTLEACAKAIKSAGAKKVYALTAAREE